jgi:nucleoid DNA-binding protein
MDKAELIDVLARKQGTERRQATDVLETMLDTIVRAVHSGDSVMISGFGVFEQRRREARVARNPRTGETVKVKPTSVPSFRPGAQFKAVVSGAQRLLPEEPGASPGGGDGDANEAAAPINTISGASPAASVSVVTVDTVHPVEAIVAESKEVQKAVSGPVIQKEARLTKRFQQYLEGHGHKVMRYRITPAGTPTLYSDLADITDKTLFEAKGSADRMSVRLALGQVLDYGRYIEGLRLAVLLPEPPAADLVELLERHDVGCVVETTQKNFIDRTTLNRCPGW